jgi:protein gp37
VTIATARLPHHPASEKEKTMAKNTKIPWCDHSLNPWIGCTPVSPACANCYAAAQDKFRHWTPEGFGAGRPRHRTSAANWKSPLKWNKDAAEVQAAYPGESRVYYDGWHHLRPRVFCASLSDWLDPEVPVEWLCDLLRLWWQCQNLDILALTKRPELWRERLLKALTYAEKYEYEFSGWIQDWTNDKPPANVWIGTTIENQKMAENRIPELLKIPARVRFLSCEPLLGPIDLRLGRSEGEPSDTEPFRERQDLLHWIICGGESGPHARPMHPNWARSLRDQCQEAGMPFFFKQWGEWAPDAPDSYKLKDVAVFNSNENGDKPILLRDLDPKRREKWDEHQADDTHMYRVGKKAAGHLLDGVEHNEFPAG